VQLVEPLAAANVPATQGTQVIVLTTALPALHTRVAFTCTEPGATRKLLNAEPSDEKPMKFVGPALPLKLW
jgi:hypothetical protein